MKSSTNTTKQSAFIDMKTERPQRGKLKALMTKASRGSRTHHKDSDSDSGQRHAVDDLEVPTHSHRRADDFLPNPRIMESPGSTPPKHKIWEGAYRNFLSIGKTNSPNGSDLSRSPDTKKSSFAIIPGTKRLVTSTSHATAPWNGLGGKKAARAQSLSVLESGNQPSGDTIDVDTRTAPSFMKGVFNRSTSDGSVSVSRRTRNYSSGSSPDDLDAAMRKGMNRNSPEYSHMSRKQASPPTFPPAPPQLPRIRGSSQEDIPTGLDDLLSSASISPHFTVETAGVRRAVSHGMIHPIAESMDNVSGHYPFYLPKRDSNGSFNYYQAGLCLEDDSSSSSDARHYRSKSLDWNAKGVPLGGSVQSSLLSQQVASHTETDPGYQQIQMGHSFEQQHYPQHVQFRHSYNEPGHSMAYNGYRNGSVIQDVSPPVGVGGLGSMMAGAAFAVGTSPSNLDGRQTPPMVPVNPEMKKQFTTFHNQARFASDATSPFLGEESPSPLYQDSYISYHMMMGGGGISMPYQAYSAMDLRSIGNFSTSLPPLETVDEHNISIHKTMRLLKPIQGVESWEPGRRYLIAPAVLASSPLTVLNRLSGNLVQSAKIAAESQIFCPFGVIDLGECLMTYIGETHHLSLGQWSSCRLVLRQNYLLEFDASATITGLPRGCVHLQHAMASSHPDFQNALVLDFYASPCAKADRRTLMIRADTREECAYLITCLNRASQLKIEHLWEYASGTEFGRGRYATVFPARRRTEHASLVGDGSPVNNSPKPMDKQSALAQYNCALKVIDKAQFWHRVVKGRERADTLVRETSVQATLTAKCGKIATFLKLRGFFETSENFVIELELLEGTDLFQHISSKGTLPEHEAAMILRDMLTSLEAMNRVGLAHRDIKPANVLMCDRKKDGVSVKVGDFGMSTFVGVDGLVRGRCGTPGYVAPEILTGGSRIGYSNAVDVFSAGVTLYVMLCGYEPFYGENEKDLIEANKRAVVEFPDEDWGRISNDARNLVLSMTHPDPKQRISARDALRHPWITRLDEGNDPDQPADSKTLDHSQSIAPPADAPTEGACIVS